MNRGTIISVSVALLSLVGAIGMAPKELPPAVFEDTGEPLFKGFTDPTLATSLEVVTWDEEGAKVRSFKVEQQEGRWVIPSHNSYPADATERMGKAAASFVDVKRDVYYGDNPADHAAFGVLDPDSTDGKAEDRGKRVTIKDVSGGTLVDIIVGKRIESKDGYSYVRLAGEKRVYGSKLDLDISTTFADWIEKDLLRLDREDVASIVYDPYQVDEAKGQVVNRNPIRVEKPKGDAAAEPGGAGADWGLAAGVTVPKDKSFDAAKVGQLLGAVDRLQIVGVRPRPKPLTLDSLLSKGFFVTEDGQLFGNEGELRVVTKSGVVYTLFFGEVTYESGIALTAGAGEADAKGAGDAKEGSEANRYLFVNVAYSPEHDQGAKAAPTGDDAGWEGDETKKPAGKPDDEKPAADTDKGPSKGQTEAKALSSRFGDWFFVISDASFKQIHLDREDFWKAAASTDKDKKDKKPHGDAP